jgi:intracellular multiplication protein IcmP
MRSQPHPRAAWPSGDDNTGFNLIVILLGCCVGAYLLWTCYHGEISAGVITLRHHEIAFIRHFTDRYDLADRQMLAADPEGVTLRDLYVISHAVGMFFRVPAAVFMLLLAAICTVRAAPARYKRAFDLEGLIREQAASFRTSAAFVRRRLRLVTPAGASPRIGSGVGSRAGQRPNPRGKAGSSPDDPRPADYALTPEESIARFATALDGDFDEAPARRALVRQLGPRWRGLQGASPQVRCLFAAFALQLAQRCADAQRLLGDLSASLANPDQDEPAGPDTPLALRASAGAQANALLGDGERVTPALAIADRHAYTHTALMELLNAARLRGGVLAPGQFAWLKLVDRRLWYALYSLGFETEGFGRYCHPNPRVEAIGARDHWAVERLAGQPVIEPSLDRAIEALRKVAQLRRFKHFLGSKCLRSLESTPEGRHYSGIGDAGAPAVISGMVGRAAPV